MTINRTAKVESLEIARYDGDNCIIIVDDNCDYFFDEYHYSVYDVLGDAAEEFPYSKWDEYSRPAAYEKAARFYNSLVPDADAIPLF